MLHKVIAIIAIAVGLAGCTSSAPSPSPAAPNRIASPPPMNHRETQLETNNAIRAKAASGTIRLIVNGLPASTAPIIKSGTTYVPVRPAGEMLNKIVSWDGPTKTVYINDNQQTLTKPSSHTLKLIVNGKLASAAPIIINGTTYVPVRAAGEMLSKIVTWAAATKTVFITDRQYDIVLDFPADRYPETASHIKNAIKRGKPPVCTIDRDGADENRGQSLAGIPTKEGYDRDEFPMAMCAEGGTGADVAYVKSADNRGAGSWIGNFLHSYPNGKRILFVIGGTAGTVTPTPTTPTSPGNVYYKNCDAVRAAGAAPLYKGQPGYSTSLDRDRNGVACEN